MCALTTDQLVVVGGSNKKVTGVVFKDDGKRIGADTSGPNGVYSITWKTASLKKGVHHLTALLTDSAGHRTVAGRQLKVCK